MATATTTAQVCRNFINGRWVESRSGRTVERRNPANLDEIIGLAPLSTREETREAIAAARNAFAAWRDTPAPVRGRVIAKAALVMEQQKEELARILTREEGKTVKDSLGEVQKSINILEFMAGEARRMGGETLPSELPKNFAYTMKQPLGVVAAITPWNFPVSIPVSEPWPSRQWRPRSNRSCSNIAATPEQERRNGKRRGAEFAEGRRGFFPSSVPFSA